MEYALVGIVCLLLGVVIGRFLLQKVFNKAKTEAEEEAKLIIKEAQLKGQNLEQERILAAKEKTLKLREEFDEEVKRKERNFAKLENKVKQKDQSLTKSLERAKKEETALEIEKENLEAQMEIVKNRKEELAKLHTKQVTQLEKIANLTADEAREQMIEALKGEAQTHASGHIKEIMDEAKLTAAKQAKKIVVETIQRTAAEHAIENCVSVFNIESDDIKGKIIGREGRNIRALEAATGVEIIVDDTPEAIIISGFDPVRREIARLSLHRLVADGRIHPARIEEIVKKTTKHIEEEIVEIGERAAIDLGVHGLHPELIKLVGRMRFRSSYGQNLLHHSKEVARLCATMAAELGLNVKLAKRAGLLHDIGKVVTEENELPHAVLGMELCLKYKESKEVSNAVGAHHDEVPMEYMISPIIQVCDAISGSRPGARREVVESYIKRLKDLESLATSFDGVQKAYAIQAGRELRVIVNAESVNDDIAGKLSFDISQKIEADMQYPGQIKVTVIREMRAVHYAK